MMIDLKLFKKFVKKANKNIFNIQNYSGNCHSYKFKLFTFNKYNTNYNVNINTNLQLR